MPSASAKVPTTQDKDVKSTIDLTEPFKQVVTLVEHKIRNMEKRKLKLDGYKQEQEQGKDLNADQLAAVAKYGELMQTLEFARDLSKQVSQIQLETSRLLKKQNKREQSERSQAEADRTKETMILTNWLHRLVMLPHVRADFVNGNNPRRIALSSDENQAIDELATINLANFDMSLNVASGVVLDHFSNLVEGKEKKIPKTSMTYSHMKKLLLSLNSVPYAFEQPKFQLSNKSDSDDADISADSSEDITLTAAVVPESQMSNEAGNYNYIQKGIESPDMDPAVVVTSTNAPPQLMTQQLATMQQVIPQSSQLAGSQPDFDHDKQGQEEVIADGTYNGTKSGGPEVDVGQGHLRTQGASIMSQGQQEAGTGDTPPQPQEWEIKTGPYDGYGANPGETVEGNGFMDNNFSTWEGPQTGDGGGNNRSGSFRRGGGGRFQNTNGYQARGGSRYQGNQGGSGGNRWVPPPGERTDRGYEEYRGRGENRDRGEGAGDYKPRGSGMRGGRGNATDARGGGDRNYYNNGYQRNGGAPRGTGGRRPYRGGYGSGSGQDQGGVPTGAY